MPCSPRYTRNGILVALENHFANCNNIIVNCHLAFRQPGATRKWKRKVESSLTKQLFPNLSWMKREENFGNSSSRHFTPYFNYVFHQGTTDRRATPSSISSKSVKMVVGRISLRFDIIQVFFFLSIRLPLACTISSSNCDFKCLRRNVSLACSFPIKIDEEQFSNKWQRK